MKKIVICLLAGLWFLQPAKAQSLVKKINDIKLEEEVYYWDEYTHPSADTAYVKACEWLVNQVDTFPEKKFQVADFKPYIKDIKVLRGQLTLAFVYLKKSDAQAVIEGKPAVEEPVRREEVPAIDTPVPPRERPTLHPVVKSVMSMKEAKDVFTLLQEQMKSGQVGWVGSTSKSEKLDDCHIVIFDGNTIAPLCVLSPVIDGDQRTNLTTGQPDDMDNYHGYYAIAFTLK